MKFSKHYVPDDVSKDHIELYCCESCYFEECCKQTEWMPHEILECQVDKPFYWKLEENDG